MEINPKLYKLIKKFITREIKGSDVFIHNGSKWLIFEEDKKWVIELTKEGTLWYYRALVDAFKKTNKNTKIIPLVEELERVVIELETLVK